MTDSRISATDKRVLIACGLGVAVLVAASQWYFYDAVHRQEERFTYYLATCAYLCGVLAPVVIWLGRRRPIDSGDWKRSLPIHLAASLLLTALGVCTEASIGWLHHASQWSYWAALRHYFTQHTQISIVTYWALLGGFHVYRIYDHARRREVHAAQLEARLREAQLTALRSQLQPHFLFNTLQAATTSVYDDPQGSEEILLSLSELLRISLQVFERQEIPLGEEIDFLNHYAAIQQRRFGDRLRVDFQIPEECRACALPALLLQPLIENAIRYGVGLRKEADVVTVRASLNQDLLHIDIRNLTSILDDSLDRLISRGVGLANTIARLQHLYGPQKSFVIRNVLPQGVAVSLSVPARVLPFHSTELEIYEHSGANHR
ncbi:MAG: histidine kinase [Acidobacteriaceae bacterium]|nr:histidine kinase [Acidobacteriaceae bacterium]